MNDGDIPELTERDFDRSISRRTRERLMNGNLRGGVDIQALRRFVGLSRIEFAAALGVSLRTVHNWEQDRRRPAGPALVLIRIAARHPGLLREKLAPAR